MMSVSGRIGALVDRVRFGAPAVLDMTSEEFASALRRVTVETFGSQESDGEAPMSLELPRERTQSAPTHILFFFGLALGGTVGALLYDRFNPSMALRGELFAELFGGPADPLAIAVLILGGVLVGFGTRMAGGCTSGHGLVGSSLFQKASLLSTAAFFGAGVATALIMEALS